MASVAVGRNEAHRQITSAGIMRNSCWAEHVPRWPARKLETSTSSTASIKKCGR